MPAPKIAKAIHLTFPRKFDLPLAIAENIAAIRLANPDYSVNIYDDQDVHAFIANEFDSVILQYFERINPIYGAARADFFRYLCIYKLGGIYIDIKAHAQRPFSTVLRDDDQFLLGQWDPDVEGGRFSTWGLGVPELPGGEFQQWHVIAAAGHPFLKAIILKILSNIDNYQPFRDGVGEFGVIRTTGPIAYTKAILPLLDIHPHRRIWVETDLGLHYSIYGQQIGAIESPQAQQAPHRQHFPNHYTRQTAPLISTGWLIDGSFIAWQSGLAAARAFWRWSRLFVRARVMKKIDL